MFTNSSRRYRAAGTVQSPDARSETEHQRSSPTTPVDEKHGMNVAGRSRSKALEMVSPRMSSKSDMFRDTNPRCLNVCSWRFLVVFLFVCIALSYSGLYSAMSKVIYTTTIQYSFLGDRQHPPLQNEQPYQLSVNHAQGSQDENANDDDNVADILPELSRRQLFHKRVPKCAQNGQRARSFLIIFMGHSGSTAIISELKSHPETYIEKYELVDHGENVHNFSRALETARSYFDRAIALGKVPGFKIRPRHIRLRPQAWANLANEYDTRIIWQYRRNTLKHAVGEYAYRYLGDDRTKEGIKSEQDFKTKCDTGIGCSFEIKNMTAFHEILVGLVGVDQVIAEAASLIANGRDCLHELRYEDYLYYRKGSMTDLKQFLGLKQIETHPARYKTTEDNLCNVVSNWAQLCEHFYGCTLWRHLFEDHRNQCSCPFSASPGAFCNVILPARNLKNDNSSQAHSTDN